ncbi:MAG: DUF167 domain-containing protein [Verrucomicrobiota bacterium]
MPPATFLRETAGGTLLSVKLQPRASKNEICAPIGDELKIKVTAPPVDAAANQALVEFLADKLDCSRGKVELGLVPLGGLGIAFTSMALNIVPGGAAGHPAIFGYGASCGLLLAMGVTAGLSFS